MRQIIWKGNQYTNSSSREGYVPFVIVDHISGGTMQSMDYWFTDPSNNVSSAHFGISRTGEIHQYVAIEEMAWANGLKKEQIADAKAQVVHDMGVNPNLYTVSIEHEGTVGDLTEEQFQASVWLHRYICDYIRTSSGKDFPLDEYHVIGHFQVNPIAKPDCPGPQFPWERLHTELAKGDEHMLSVEDANKIIAFLSAAWNATDIEIARDEFHRLANELRKASGQPEE